MPLPNIEDRVLSKDPTPRVILNQTRMEGKLPIFVVEIGDEIHYAQATGDVANGVTKRVYLTVNGEATGDSRFGTGMPEVTVRRDMKRTQGGLSRASGPSAPGSALQLREEAGHDLIWDGTNEVWAVDFTNSTGATANYLVQARGVK